jgi:hypothetical protein
MDEKSKEELRVYSILYELEDRQYHESELKKIFNFKKSLNTTNLYKYIHMENLIDSQKRMFTILKGELVTGSDIQGRTPILRGKYKITTVIDGVPFTYVKRKDGE